MLREQGGVSVSSGSVCPFASPSDGGFTHCVSPTWPAIMATAFGEDGPVAVWWKLSNRLNRSANCHRNGIVSQWRWETTTSPFCLVCRFGAEVGARPDEFT